VIFAAVAHAGESQSSSLEMLNIIELLKHYVHTPFVGFLEHVQTEFFSALAAAALGLLFYFASKNAKLIPGKLQAACELVVEGLNQFVCGILGPSGRRHTPFLGTLFLYIWFMNLMGLVPLLKSPTSSSLVLTMGPVVIPIPTVTLSLAILVFLYVQVFAIRENGIVGYLDHMAGSPRDIFGWILLPLMFVIHLIGELAKPVSLAFRLYGNIWGEDVLLAVFIGLGIGMTAFCHFPSGVPIHFPFMLLALVTGTIQAFVFMLLSTVYIAMMSPHGEEAHAHGAHGEN